MPRWVLGVLLLVALVIGSPWIAYHAGMANLDGTPASPLDSSLAPEQLEYLHVATRKAGVFKVEPMSPFDYALAFVQEPEKLSSGGMKATEIVAADWVASHSRRPEPAARRLSELAMTIWLTENWKTDEILVRAYEIERAKGLRRKR